jgi:hypothetical protein
VTPTSKLEMVSKPLHITKEMKEKAEIAKNYIENKYNRR